MRIPLSMALIVAATALSAQTYRAENLLYVNPVSATSFEVIQARGEGPRGLFCAAGSYAERQLGVSRGRVYVLIPSGPSKTMPGRKAVTFTVNPDLVTPVTGYSIAVDTPGYGLPAFHARQFCKDYIEKDDYEWDLSR